MFTAVLELKNPSSPIFPKIGGTKDKGKEETNKKKNKIVKVSCFINLVLNQS